MNIVETYLSYSEGLATHHPSILHNPTDVSQTRFGVENIEMVMQGKLSNALIGDTIFRALSPVFRPFSDETEGNLQKVEAGFIILRKTSLTDSVKLLADMGICAAVVKDCICRIVHDCRNHHPLFDDSINRLDDAQFTYDIQPFSGDGQFIAIIVSYVFQTSFVESISQHVQQTQWLDLI